MSRCHYLDVINTVGESYRLYSRLELSGLRGRYYLPGAKVNFLLFVDDLRGVCISETGHHLMIYVNGVSQPKNVALIALEAN